MKIRSSVYSIWKDCLKSGFLICICLIIGFILNGLRPKPLSLVYSNQKQRLNAELASIPTVINSSALTPGDVTTAEMIKISLQREAIILDARPEIFFTAGHIPTALSLPRDDFAAHYRSLQNSLKPMSLELVVYCTGSDCQDSEMVAGALQKLGYTRVHIYRDGWNAWENHNLPEEESK